MRIIYNDTKSTIGDLVIHVFINHKGGYSWKIYSMETSIVYGAGDSDDYDSASIEANKQYDELMKGEN